MSRPRVDQEAGRTGVSSNDESRVYQALGPSRRPRQVSTAARNEADIPKRRGTYKPPLRAGIRSEQPSIHHQIEQIPRPIRWKYLIRFREGKCGLLKPG